MRLPLLLTTAVALATLLGCAPPSEDIATEPESESEEALEVASVPLAVGTFHSCVVVDGGVKCWGSNTYGALGDGSDKSTRYLPVDVVGLSDIKAITAGLTGGPAGYAPMGPVAVVGLP